MPLLLVEGHPPWNNVPVQQLRVLLNPEHPLFGILPYEELLACLHDPHLHPLHPDQLLLTESAQDFINL